MGPNYSQNYGAAYAFFTRKEFIKDSVPIFKGEASEFEQWQRCIFSYTQQAGMSLTEILRFMTSKTTGDVKSYLDGELRAFKGTDPSALDNIWYELKERFGATQRIAEELNKKIENFPAIEDARDGSALLRLHDLCQLIFVSMDTCPELLEFNTPKGLKQIRWKLPEDLQMEWGKYGTAYERQFGSHPTFENFKKFLREEAKIRANMHYEILKKESIPKEKTTRASTQPTTKKQTKVLVTDVKKKRPPAYCFLHKSEGHWIIDCPDFAAKSPEERKAFAEANWICITCLRQHSPASSCYFQPKCATCNAGHDTLMHECHGSGKESAGKQPKHRQNQKQKQKQSSSKPVSVADCRCTVICKDLDGKRNSKIFMVDMTKEDSSKSIRGYVMVDDQASCTLLAENLPDHFGGKYPTETLNMATATGKLRTTMTCHRMSGLRVKGIYCDEVVELPSAVTCQDLVDSRKEYATEIYLNSWSHTIPYASNFPPYDCELPMLALIGRDCHAALPFTYLTDKAPFVGKSRLGYALIGDMCPRTPNEQAKVLRVELTDKTGDTSIQLAFLNNPNRGFNVFSMRRDDEELGLSLEDKQFLAIVSNGARVDEEGSLEIPLPFKSHENLPDRSAQAYRRTEGTLKALKQNPAKLAGCLDNIQRSLQNGHIEQVPQQEIKAH